MKKLIVLLTMFIFCMATQGLAQEKPAGGEAQAHSPGEEHHGKSADELAKELTNPNNSIAKLTFKNQYRWYTGDLPGADDQDNYTLLFQPVFPFKLASKGDEKNVLFVRPAFPFVINQPVPVAGPTGLDWDEVSAMGDIVMDVAYGRTYKSGWLWAAGVVTTWPSATDSQVAGKQFRAGPEAVLAYINKWGLFGFFPSHQWDYAGWADDDADYSVSSFQLFVVHTAGGGWTIGTQPILTYDWESEDWTIPVELYISKTTILGKMPFKFELQLDYYIEQPDAFGPDWLVSFNVTPIVPNFIANWISGK
jgi:hypothetical protein